MTKNTQITIQKKSRRSLRRDQRGYGSIELIAIAFALIGLAIAVVGFVQNQANAGAKAMGDTLTQRLSPDGTAAGVDSQSE